MTYAKMEMRDIEKVRGGKEMYKASMMYHGHLS